MKQDRRLSMVVVVAVLGAVAFVWLLTLDVYVSETGVDGAPAFCGSAYDVALIKRDGYMGGEVPANEAVINRACVKKARTDVGLAVLVALTALGGSAYALGRYNTQPRQRADDEAQPEMPAARH